MLKKIEASEQTFNIVKILLNSYKRSINDKNIINIFLTRWKSRLRRILS